MSSYYEKMLATGEVKCIDEEVPFEIPKGWEWCKINNIAFVTKLAGFEYTKYIAGNLKTNGIPLFKGKNVQGGKIIYEFEAYIPESLSDELERSQISKKCLLTPYVGTIGNIGLHNKSGKFHLGSNVGKIEILNPASQVCILEEFVHIYLLSQYGYAELTKYKKATAQESISIEAIRDVLLPIPPTIEQQKIVDKYYQLETFADKYSKLQGCLDKLNTEIFDKFKKSVLQEAIQGKLVPQIASEGTAHELLEQIKIEKQELVKEGKLKKSALNNSVIFRGDDNKYYEKVGKKIVCIEDEVPFEIPNSWVWVRLCAIVDFSKSQTISSSMLDMDSWILDLEDIEKDSGRLLQKKRMKELLSKSDKHLFYKGNVLYSKLRPYLNKVIVADEDGACTTEILAFDFGHIYNKYAQAYLMSPFFVDYANSDSYGIKMPRLGSKKGNNALFPIPPLREQQCVVALFGVVKLSKWNSFFLDSFWVVQYL